MQYLTKEIKVELEASTPRAMRILRNGISNALASMACTSPDRDEIGSMWGEMDGLRTDYERDAFKAKLTGKELPKKFAMKVVFQATPKGVPVVVEIVHKAFEMAQTAMKDDIRNLVIHDPVDSDKKLGEHCKGCDHQKECKGGCDGEDQPYKPSAFDPSDPMYR